MDLSRKTVQDLKKLLKQHGLPLGGVKADLVTRLSQYYQQHQLQQGAPQLQHQQLGEIQQQLQQIPQQIQQIQQIQHQLYTTAHTTNQQYLQQPLHNTTLTSNTYKPSTKTFELVLGLVDPRDKFGSIVCTQAYGEDDVLVHENIDWSFYCTKSMDYQVWATVYFKCLKKKSKKRGLEAIPNVEATIEFPTGKRIQGMLTSANLHRLVVIKEANETTLSKSFGADSTQKISNVKVSLRTVNDAEVRSADQSSAKKVKKDQAPSKDKDDELCSWGVYGQMDSDDENRSEYESSDYSSDGDDSAD